MEKVSRKGFIKGLAGILGLGSFVGFCSRPKFDPVESHRKISSIKRGDVGIGRGNSNCHYVDECCYLYEDMSKEEYEKRFPRSKWIEDHIKTNVDDTISWVRPVPYKPNTVTVRRPWTT